MRRFLKEYFTLTKSERNGLLVLLFLLTISIFYPVLYNWIVPAEELNVEILAFTEKSSANSKEEKFQSSPAFNPEPFNPNQLDRKGFLSLGLDSATTAHILSYREAGGKFYEKTDLLKIYSLDKETFLKLEPYIRIGENEGWNEEEAGKWSIRTVDINKGDSLDFEQLPGIGPVYSQRIVNYRGAIGGFDSLEHLMQVYGIEPQLFEDIRKYLRYSAPEKEGDTIRKVMANEGPTPVIRNINEVDSAQLRQIKGIGPYFASRIVKYREALGGFHSLDQLYEIYNLDSSVVNNMKGNYTVSGKLNKLNLNKASVKELSRHPYINRAVAEFIVSYRVDHIRISDLDELLSSYLVDEELLLKIAPYIEL